MPRLDFYSNFKLFVKVQLEESDVLIGRSSECTVQLPDERVSRVHAVISKRDGGYSLQDHSLHGTRLNHTVVEGPVELKPGDRIYIEGFIIVFQPDDVPPAAFQETPTSPVPKE